MDNIDIICDELEDRRKETNTRWLNTDLFGRKIKKKTEFNFNMKKRNYRFNPVPRADLYEPIRFNQYYISLKKNGINKDNILCGIHEDAIAINQILFDCFTVADLKSGERQMFQWVLSNTTGFKRREVRLNVGKIADYLGRSRAFVYTALHNLFNKKMLFITQNNDYLTIYINTMPNTWLSVGDRVMKVLSDVEFSCMINEDP